MKILHVSDFLPGTHDSVGGAEYVAQRIIQEQSKMGLSVEIATLRPDSEIDTPPWEKHHVYGNLDQYAGKASYAVKQMFLPYDAIASKGLQRIIEQSKPDIVHYHNLHYSGLSVLSKAKQAGIPSFKSIYDYWIFCPSNMLLKTSGELCKLGHGEHCVDCVGARRLKAAKPLKRYFFGRRKQVFEDLVSNIDRFMVLSNASQELLVHHGIDAEQIDVIPQYIWAEAQRSSIIEAPVPGRLVYVGWVDERKGLHVVIDALLLLANEFPQLHIEVLGLPANSSYQAAIHQKLEEANLQDRVNFSGRISREQLLEEIRKATLVVIPEQWENMSPVILTESMAAGVCPLASRVGGIKHFVEDGISGLLAERDDPAHWAEKIRYAIENPEEIKHLARAAKDRASDVFNPESINLAMVDAYKAAITRIQ